LTRLVIVSFSRNSMCTWTSGVINLNIYLITVMVEIIHLWSTAFVSAK
jgi:hypothetical protein